MKLSKVLMGATILTSSVLLLAACGGSDSKKSSSSSESKTESTSVKPVSVKTTAGGELKDGTYKLEETGYSNGYKATFSITAKDNKITKVDYDNVNKDGKSKIDDKDYNKNMEKVTKTGPAKFIPALNEAFMKSGVNLGNVEVISGATHSTESFLNYAQQLIQAAQAGNKETIKIDNTAKMVDGTYKLEEKNYSNGYRVTFEITVAGNKITESKYDNINKDGKSKTEDTEYNESMQKVAKMDPKTYIPKLNEELVAAESPAEVEVVTGATHSTHSFILYAEQLVNAAQAGKTDTIMVDNYVFKD